MTRVMLSLTIMAFAASVAVAAPAGAKEPQWYLNAEYIEACSCTLFCACYFNPTPDKDFCQFNNAIRVKRGNYGDVKLDGMKIWMSGDLGSNFADGDLDSVVLTFEPSAPKAQVDAAIKVIGHIYPMKIKKFAVDRAPIVWEMRGKTAYARLGNGKGEVRLTRVEGNDGGPVVINNLKYWGAKSNKGFHLYKSEHHYKGHGHDYRFKDANGFTIEIESGTRLRQAAR